MKKIKKKKRKHQKALNIVRHFFPQVESVRDSDKNIIVEVTYKDSSNSTVKDHANCALAVACKRSLHADGVMISTRTAYVIQGKKAFRFRLPESASREIVSFDRNAGFAPGKYMIKAPGKCEQLGVKMTGATHQPSNRQSVRFRHVTTGIRTALGSRVAIT